MGLRSAFSRLRPRPVVLKAKTKARQLAFNAKARLVVFDAKANASK